MPIHHAEWRFTDTDHTSNIGSQTKTTSTLVANSCPCRVLALHADAIGALKIELEGGHVLDVFPDSSTDEEQWRLFSPYEACAHAVFSAGELRDH